MLEKKSHEGFTLIEMLVVIGIIVILIGASIGGFTAMTKSAEKAKAQELVSNVAVALTALYQAEGNWPKRLANQGGGDGQLDENAALPLAKGKYLSLTTKGSGTDMKLAGVDRFGVITPWAAAIVKSRGTSASADTVVASGIKVKDHRLYYAIDLDGDGIVEASVGGESVRMRATAAVWCIGKSGGNKGKPWPYSTGRRKDDVYSWNYGQTQKVN